VAIFYSRTHLLHASCATQASNYRERSRRRIFTTHLNETPVSLERAPLVSHVMHPPRVHSRFAVSS